MNSFGKLLRLRKIRQLALHPDHVSVRCVRDRTVDGRGTTALESVEALTGPRRVPVPVDVHTGEALGDRAGLGVRLALHGGLVLLNQALLVDVHAGVDGRDDGVVEEHQARLLHPLGLDALEGGADLALLLSGDHEVVEGLEVGVGGAQDEAVVARVDGRRDQRGGFRVGARYGEQVGAHDVGLCADRDQAVDVLGDGDQDLARHVAALLGARGLVLDVDACGALFDEELGELHDGSEAAVAGVGVGDDGAEVVDVGDLGALLFGCGEAFFSLLAVMEELCHEEMLDLVGDGVHGVVRQIWGGLVGG